MSDPGPNTTPRGAGGTPGGVGPFLAGTLMAVAGGYLLLQQVTVTTGGFRFFGMDSFGLSLVPLLVGIGWLFMNGRSPFAWLLTVSGAVIILVGVLAHLDIYFRPTSLFNTLLMLGLLAGGIGLLARSVKAQ